MSKNSVLTTYFTTTGNFSNVYFDTENFITGCSAVGSARDLGSRGRAFESPHSDHKNSHFLAKTAVFYNFFRILHFGRFKIYLVSKFPIHTSILIPNFSIKNPDNSRFIFYRRTQTRYNACSVVLRRSPCLFGEKGSGTSFCCVSVANTLLQTKNEFQIAFPLHACNNVRLLLSVDANQIL